MHYESCRPEGSRTCSVKPWQLIIARTVPWAKANLNYTGQALVISAATIASYFIVAEQTILECSRKASYAASVEREQAATRSEAA